MTEHDGIPAEVPQSVRPLGLWASSQLSGHAYNNKRYCRKHRPHANRGANRAPGLPEQQDEDVSHETVEDASDENPVRIPPVAHRGPPPTLWPAARQRRGPDATTTEGACGPSARHDNRAGRDESRPYSVTASPVSALLRSAWTTSTESFDCSAGTRSGFAPVSMQLVKYSISCS